MGQVTQATIDMIVNHTQRGEMPPLTIWEVQQLAVQAQRYQAIHAMSEKLAGKVKPGEGYPEGFDESCGVPAFAMRYANMALASTIGDCDWDVPCVASAITGPLRDLHSELNKMKWSGVDEGWDLAIEAVRKHIAEILTVKQPVEGVMSEWIEWKGGECPVQGREFVEFKCPNDDKIYSHNACGLRWKHIGSMDDIIAYRVVKEKEAC